MKRTTIAVLVAALVPLAFWLAGFDFDHRGEAAFTCFFVTVIVFGYAMFAPYS